MHCKCLQFIRSRTARVANERTQTHSMYIYIYHTSNDSISIACAVYFVFDDYDCASLDFICFFVDYLAFFVVYIHGIGQF